jgi:hypothetical protein
MVLYGKQSHLRWEERINDLDKEAFFDLSVEVYQVFDGDKRAYLHWPRNIAWKYPEPPARQTFGSLPCGFGRRNLNSLLPAGAL